MFVHRLSANSASLSFSSSESIDGGGQLDQIEAVYKRQSACPSCQPCRIYAGLLICASSPGISTETGTIAGVASALAMALIGAVSSYISYQQKKFCFSIQRKCTPEQGKGPRRVLIPSPGYSTPVGFLAGTLLHP